MAKWRTWAVLGVVTCLVEFNLVALLGERAAAAERTSDTQAAVAAAEAWLAGIDAGHYAESWDQAAELFRKAVPKATWAAQLEGVRAPLGKLETRRVKSTQAATSLPGAPDGHYVVIQFDAAYANKKSAVETVTPVLEKDGAWRVSGYYIR